jgi:hypothetical protein
MVDLVINGGWAFLREYIIAVVRKQVVDGMKLSLNLGEVSAFDYGPFRHLHPTFRVAEFVEGG